MKTLARELSVFNTEDEEIRKINENFIRTAHSLQGNMDAAEEDEASASVFKKHGILSKKASGIFSLETSGGGALVDDENGCAPRSNRRCSQKWTSSHRGGDRAGRGADCGCA